MCSRTTVNSESPPPGPPSPWHSTSKHRLGSPSVQGAHAPHGHSGSIATRSPTATDVTPSPSSTTSPENSWPITVGNGAGLIGPTKNWCRSVPHSPLWRDCTFTVPGVGSGSGMSSRRTSPGP